MSSIARDPKFVDDFAPDHPRRFEDELSREHFISEADFPARNLHRAAARTVRQCRARAGVDIKIRRILVGELDAGVLRGGRDDLAVAKDFIERHALLHEFLPMMFFEFLRRHTGLAGEPGAQFMVTLDIEPNPLVQVPSRHRRVEAVVRGRLIVVILCIGELIELPMQLPEHVERCIDTECRRVFGHDLEFAAHRRAVQVQRAASQ